MDKKEWNGEGLPPVGATIEVFGPIYGANGGCRWVERTVVAHVHGTVLAESTTHAERYVKYTRPNTRPIRSEEDRAIDEMVEVFINHYESPKSAESYALIARALYRAGYRKTEQ